MQEPRHLGITLGFSASLSSPSAIPPTAIISYVFNAVYTHSLISALAQASTFH